MKGIWNRLRLVLLGGILAFAGAGIVSPLAAGVVAEAAVGVEETITLVGIKNTSSGNTYAQNTDGTWVTDYVYGSVLNASGNPDPTITNAYIRHQGGYTLTLGVTNAQLVSVKLISDSKNEGNYNFLSLTSCTGTSISDGYLLTPEEGALEIKAKHSSGEKMLRYTAEVTYIPTVDEVGDIVSLRVDNVPSDVNYYIGETNSLEGLEITGLDANGATKKIELDDANLLIEPEDGHVFTEADLTPEGGAGATIMYENGSGDLIELENAWTYFVSAAPEIVQYDKLGPTEIAIGSRVILAVEYSGSYYLSAGFKSDRIDVINPDSLIGDSLGLYEDNSSASIWEVRPADGAGTISLYSKEQGKYLGVTSDGKDIDLLTTFDNEQCTWEIQTGNYPAGYRLYSAVGKRYLSYNHYSGKGRFKPYTVNSSYVYAGLYRVSTHSAYDEAAELSRYMMETDTKDQCLTKFEIAKDAYLNRMGEDGRELFKTGDTYLDAKNRYEAWARHLGQLPYEEGAVQAFRFFNGNEGSMNWAIAGASLGIAVLGAAGYLFYRKKKVAK